MIRKVKAISLWEPWATLIRLGVKVFETRSWETDYRGPLLICAAKRIVPSSYVNHLWSSNIFWYALANFGNVDITTARKLSWKQFSMKYLHPGKAVALVNLTDCISTNKFKVGSYHALFGDFSEDRFAWQLKDVQPIVPVPITGRQKLFNAELDIQIQEAV